MLSKEEFTKWYEIADNAINLNPENTVNEINTITAFNTMTGIEYWHDGQKILTMGIGEAWEFYQKIMKAQDDDNTSV